MSAVNVDPYISVVVQSGFASFYEASWLMTVEDVVNCYEIALVHNENERRAYKAAEAKSKSGRKV